MYMLVVCVPEPGALPPAFSRLPGSPSDPESGRISLSAQGAAESISASADRARAAFRTHQSPPSGGRRLLHDWLGLRCGRGRCASAWSGTDALQGATSLKSSSRF
ncbi:hypothetical protein NDU88_004362 [Pleurodeles waltl]|uniref:Uncharacterized protein n=1 Tax=Pleurodeles waltl TaxID=8319 RepID=A0AAV7V0Y0_PLEWA|nr:hypothetical protein NDU88_004362 [Pleurodeles waltl]